MYIRSHSRSISSSDYTYSYLSILQFNTYNNMYDTLIFLLYFRIQSECFVGLLYLPVEPAP